MALAPEQVGARIRKARKAKGWTHQQLANAMDADLRTVQRWQTGKNPKNGKPWLPRLTTLMDLADVLEVPSDQSRGERAAEVERLEATSSRLRTRLMTDSGNKWNYLRGRSSSFVVSFEATTKETDSKARVNHGVNESLALSVGY